MEISLFAVFHLDPQGLGEIVKYSEIEMFRGGALKEYGDDRRGWVWEGLCRLWSVVD